MLGVDASDVEPVAGDRRTGFYRCKAGAQPYGPQRPDNVAVEAYSWGGLTSGVTGIMDVIRRILWLTLLPFALVNLAYWTRPEMTERKAWSAIWMRIAGLLLTLLLVAAMFTIGVDLVAWQCFRGGSNVCGAVPGFLDFLAAPPWDSPTRRVLVGSMLPLAVLTLLWGLSRQTLHRYESVASATVAPVMPDSETSDAAVAESEEASSRSGDWILGRRNMWYGLDRTSMLRRVHITAGTAYVVVLATAPLVIGGTRQAPVVGVLVLASVLLWTALVTVAVTYRDGSEFLEVREDSTAYNVLAHVLSWSPVVLGLAYAVTMLVFAPSQVVAAPLLPGHDLGVEVPLAMLVLIVAGFLTASMGRVQGEITLIAVTVVAVIGWLSSHLWQGEWWWGGPIAAAFVVSLVWLARRRRPSTAYAWNGAGPAMVLGAAVWVAALFSTSTVVWVADYLNGGEQTVEDLQATFNSDESPGFLAATIQSSGASLRFTTEGDLTATRATLVTSGDTATITSGTLQADQLLVSTPDRRPVAIADGALVPQAQPAPADPRALSSLSGVEVSNGTVVYTGPITLVDTCVVPEQASANPCAADGKGAYVARGVLASNGSVARTLTIEGPVTLNSDQSLQEPLVVPLALVYFASVLPFWLIGVSLVSIAGYGRWRLTRGNQQAVQASLSKDLPNLRDHLRERSRKARTAAGYTHRTERMVGLIAFVTCIAALAVLLGAATGVPPWKWGMFANADSGWVRSLADAGLWVALGVSLLLLAAASRLRKSDSMRRSIGILWDLTTFWPRVAHPLGPPCYAERVVPELIDRMHWALSRGARVIVSAHSQGSTIAVAALCQLRTWNAMGWEQVRCVTYGSQLRMWYGRIFPAVFSAQAVGYEPIDRRILFRDAAPDLDQRVEKKPTIPNSSLALYLKVGTDQPHWINLFRRTDPIGFRVFSNANSVADRVVSEYSPGSLTDDPNPGLHGHSRYQFSEVYETVVSDWYGVPPTVPQPDGVLHLQPLVR